MPVSATPWPGAQAFLAMCLLGHGCAYANDTLKINASRTQTQESNLFRLPASADPMTILGKPDTADTIAMSAILFSVSKAYGLQRVELDASVMSYQYQYFKYLDFIATDYDARWRWSITPRLRGKVATSKKKTLDRTILSQSINKRNEQVDTYERVDGIYDVDGLWRVSAGLARTGQSSLFSVIGESNYQATSVDMAVTYSKTPGNSLTYSLDHAIGSLMDPLVTSTSTAGNYEETEHRVIAQWDISEKTVANIKFAHISRIHSNDARRDFSGIETDLKLTWTPSGKTMISAQWARQLSSYQTSDTNFTQTDRFSIGPLWRVSPKTVVRLAQEASLISYLGSPTLGLSNPRRDTKSSIAIYIDWQATSYASLHASIHSGLRSSNIAGYDYKSNVVNMTAQLSY